MRNPEQTKRRLIKVASKLIADLGAAGLRVDQVAAQAKVNKRMIYHYFRDKEGLTARVIEQQVSAITPMLSGREATALRHHFDCPAGSAAALFAEQSPQQAAVILLRALLDRWHLLSATPDLPMQSLLGRLSALALGLQPMFAHAPEPAASQQPQKERISLRPTVSLIQSPS